MLYKILLQSAIQQRGEESAASAGNAGDVGSIPGLGRSPGVGNGTPLQDSCLENPMDRGAWEAAVHGVAKSQTWLSGWARARAHTHTHTHTHIQRTTWDLTYSFWNRDLFLLWGQKPPQLSTLDNESPFSIFAQPELDTGKCHTICI